MKIHEYQARELLQKFGVPVPVGVVVDTPDQAAEGFKKMNVPKVWVKAQVFAGGRGKAGGVVPVKTPAEAKTEAARILSKPLVTVQTGPEGVPVKKLLLSSDVDIRTRPDGKADEYYVALVLDRSVNAPVMIASSEGGVEIEEVAKNHPEKIVRVVIDPALGLLGYQARKIAYKLGFTGDQIKQAMHVFTKLTDAFIKTDASLAEINPLIVTPPSADAPDGKVLALDAKFNFDDNALFRQKELSAMADPTETNELELAAAKHNLNYIKLDGQIGCLVNGAGLAMATMDLIKLHGSEPANFLDVGGGATEEAVTEAFRIILADKNVKGVLVNIFGGIMKCDIVAQAIVNAAKQVGFQVPLVVRLEGTNVEPARKILSSAGKDIPMLQAGNDLTDAAKKIVAAVNSRN